jgi:hypothetical protein
MAKKFLVNLDLAKNQLLNAAIQNLSSAPSSPVQGQIYYNTMEYRIYFWDGTSWVDMSGDIRDVIGGSGLNASTSDDVITLNINVDNSTIEVNGMDSIQVKDLGITTTKIANLSTDININNQSNAIPTAYAVKQYVDGVTGALGNLEGGWNASSGSFPTGSSPVYGTKKGDYWYVTVEGTVAGVNFNVGDVIVAKADNASTSSAADWIQLEVNRDQATELILGLVKIADQTTVNNGLDDTEAITPLKLKTYLDNRIGGYATYIGDGMNSTFGITHGLGTSDLIVSVYEVPTMEEVMVDVSVGSSSFITVSFATVPSMSQYRVVIKK